MQIQRTFGLGTLLALVALALSGCVHVSVGMRINTDGSGMYQFATGFSKQLIGSASSAAQLAQRFLQLEQQQVQQHGGTYRVTDDGSYITEEWDHAFTNVAELNALIQESMPTNTTTGTTTSNNASMLRVTQQGNTFHVTGVLDFSTTSSTLPPNVKALLPDAYLRVAITLPSITAHASDAVINGNTATITAKFGEKQTIDVTGGPGGALAVPSALLWGGVALVVLGAMGSAFWVRRRAARAVVQPPVTHPPFGGDPRANGTLFAGSEPFTVPSPYPGAPPPPPGMDQRQGI